MDLHESDVASQSDLDQSVERLHVAQADLKRAEAAITEAERQRVASEKNLASRVLLVEDDRKPAPPVRSHLLGSHQVFSTLVLITAPGQGPEGELHAGGHRRLLVRADHREPRPGRRARDARLLDRRDEDLGRAREPLKTDRYCTVRARPKERCSIL